MITVKLTLREAEWLKRYVQNAFVEDETASDSKHREAVFNAIPSFDELNTVRRIVGE